MTVGDSIGCDRTHGTAVKMVPELQDCSGSLDLEAARQLDLANERFKLAAAAVNCLIYDWDLERNRVERTEGLVQIVGYRPDEVEPTLAWWRDRMHPEDYQQAQETMMAALAVGDRYATEYRVRHRHNHYVYVLDQGIVIRNARGQVIRAVGSTTDISDRKRAEAERDRLLIQERQARAQAEAANRIKDEFLAVLSHELRTPLNPILGWATLLRKRKYDDATTQRALEAIERNARLQTQLIEDLLDVSRILRGTLALSSGAVDLVATLTTALETVRLAAEVKQIQIHTQIDPCIGPVSGDVGRLQQVLWNLLSNAVKFTPIGGQVTVTLEQVGSSAQLSVQDTGQGITPEFLPHVFDYFRQADSATTRQFGGLGLGLAIVHHIVELHGGTVTAASGGEGHGATFTVKLPLVPQAGQSRLRADLSSASLVDNAPLSGLQILIVDDEADTRELLTFILTQVGAVVTVVPSAPMALQTLPQLLPDLLLSDIGMPGMDGYMLLAQVRALPLDQGGCTLAIALTAYASEENAQQARAAGFDAHLAKPIEPELLLHTIQTLIADYSG